MSQAVTHSSEPYLEPFQTSKILWSVKILNRWKPITIFAKHSILDIWQGSEYTCVDVPGICCYENFIKNCKTTFLLQTPSESYLGPYQTERATGGIV